MPRIPNYVRTHRLRCGLSQRELGHLIGRSRTAVTTTEQADEPTIRILLASEIIFGVPIREMFPRLYAEMEEFAAIRAQGMREPLADRNDPAAQVKRAFLDALIDRAGANASPL